MIIDCHAHLLPPRRTAKLIQWTLRFSPTHPVPETVTLDELLDDYAQLGVSRVWNLAHAIFPDETGPLNEWNWRLGRDHPEIEPIGTCHPLAPGPLGVIDRCFDEYGFLGMKFHPYVQKFLPWDEQFFPFYERITRHGGLVIFHTGFEEFYGAALPLSGFEPVLQAFPDLIVVFAHANFPNLAEAFELVGRYPNVYLDTVHVFGAIAQSWAPAVTDVPVGDLLRRGLTQHPDRVMFGSDHPSGVGSLQQIYQDFRNFGLSPELEKALLGGTALALTERIRKRR